MLFVRKVAGPRNNESDVLNSCWLDKAKYHVQRMFEVDKVYNAVTITNKQNTKKKGSGIAQEKFLDLNKVNVNDTGRRVV